MGERGWKIRVGKNTGRTYGAESELGGAILAADEVAGAPDEGGTESGYAFAAYGTR